MKYALSFTLLFLFGMNAFGQQSLPEDTLTSEHYLKKSKKQNTVAKVFLGVGTAAVVGGVLISTAPDDDVGKVLSTVFIGVPLILAGVVLDLVSIPLFKSASISKKRARELDTSLGLGTAALPSSGGRAFMATEID
jgi:hypothetical protein